MLHSTFRPPHLKFKPRHSCAECFILIGELQLSFNKMSPFPWGLHNGTHFIVYNGLYSSTVANYSRYLAGDIINKKKSGKVGMLEKSAQIPNSQEVHAATSLQVNPTP